MIFVCESLTFSYSLSSCKSVDLIPKIIFYRKKGKLKEIPFKQILDFSSRLYLCIYLLLSNHLIGLNKNEKRQLRTKLDKNNSCLGKIIVLIPQIKYMKMMRPKRQTSRNNYPSLRWNTHLNTEEFN